MRVIGALPTIERAISRMRSLESSPVTAISFFDRRPWYTASGMSAEPVATSSNEKAGKSRVAASTACSMSFVPPNRRFRRRISRRLSGTSSANASGSSRNSAASTLSSDPLSNVALARLFCLSQVTGILEKERHLRHALIAAYECFEWSSRHDLLDVRVVMLDRPAGVSAFDGVADVVEADRGLKEIHVGVDRVT